MGDQPNGGEKGDEAVSAPNGTGMHSEGEQKSK
jgi:hypothetical protein